MTRLGTGEKLLPAVLANLGSGSVASDIRCAVVYGNIVVWLVPHALRGAFLADLGRFGIELDGWRIFGRRLVVERRGLVGRVCAVAGGESARGGRSQGWCKHPGGN